MLFWNIKHKEWPLENMKWTGECLPTPPQLCPHGSGDVNPRCAGMSSLSHGQEFVTTGWQSFHSNAGSHPLPLCWEGNLGVWCREGDSEHLISGEICSCVCLGSWAWFCHGNRQKQLVQEWGTALLVADRDQGSATVLCEISHHQMIFCIQICSREHIPSGSNLGKFREKGYKQLCLQHNVFLARIQPIPLV